MLPRVSVAESQHHALCWKVPATVDRWGWGTRGDEKLTVPGALSGRKKASSAPCTLHVNWPQSCRIPPTLTPTTVPTPPPPRPGAHQPQRSAAPQGCPRLEGRLAGERQQAQTATRSLAGLSPRWRPQATHVGGLRVQPHAPLQVLVPLRPSCVTLGICLTSLSRPLACEMETLASWGLTNRLIGRLADGRSSASTYLSQFPNCVCFSLEVTCTERQSEQFSATDDIHDVVQPQPPSSSKTLPGPQRKGKPRPVSRHAFPSPPQPLLGPSLYKSARSGHFLSTKSHTTWPFVSGFSHVDVFKIRPR